MEETKIKAIETVYNGYRFRSRLEARWAVFFDALGIKYEYEKEGFDLGNAGWYLPDFWLPQLEMWVEVKGQQPTDIECKKVTALVMGTKKKAAIVGPIPEDNALTWDESYIGFVYSYHPEDLSDSIFPEETVCTDYPYYFCKCSQCHALGFHYDGRIRQCRCGEHMRDDNLLIDAYLKARQARFEYGEKG